MSYKVIEGSKLSCTFGSTHSCLQVPKCHGMKLQNKNAATILDKEVGINITSFGNCTKGSETFPCTPIFLTNWLLGNEEFKIREEVALIDCCILPCMKGGIVKIESSGQKE